MADLATHNTAVTQFVEGNGLRYAYRILGAPNDVPLVLCQRFRGTMDDWDPALIDRLAGERRVILFDNAGIGMSTGETPDTITAMARNIVEFLRLIGVDRADLLGFSLGGYVAQMVTLNDPALVRRVVLAGTGPGGGEGIVHPDPEIRSVAGRPVLGLEEYLYLFFAPSETSQAAGRRYWRRVNERGPEREPPASEAAVKAQVAALGAWWQGQGSAFPRLGEIRQPVLVANGFADAMVPTINSVTMAQRIKDAMLILYPDSGHGFLFQYPKIFSRHVLDFLKQEGSADQASKA
jgi:pimeloyl-ACP methyl ester carboxylesterase